MGNRANTQKNCQTEEFFTQKKQKGRFQKFHFQLLQLMEITFGSVCNWLLAMHACCLLLGPLCNLWKTPNLGAGCINFHILAFLHQLMKFKVFLASTVSSPTIERRQTGNLGEDLEANKWKSQAILMFFAFFLYYCVLLS